MMRGAYRRGSDTSTQSLAPTANVQASTAGITQATSTGDLGHAPQVPHQMPFAMSPLFMQPNAINQQINMNQFLNQPVVPIPARQRVRKPQDSSAPTFSHGISEQTNMLLNPLLETRRPDTKIPYHTPSRMSHLPIQTTPNGSIINQMPNFGFSPMINQMAFQGQPMAFPFNNFPQMTNNPYLVNNNMMQQMDYSGASTSYLPFNATATPAYTVYASFANQNQCQSLDELQALMRERSEHLHLIAPVDSGSEIEEAVCLPIAISDSEGFFTDGGGHRMPIKRVLSRN
jgi:hypothetical protein